MSAWNLLMSRASSLVILRYEGVGGEGQLGADELDWQLSALASCRQVIPLSDVALYLRGRCQLPRRGVALTFDMTDEATLSVAGELLAKHSVPATFFAISDEVDALPGGWSRLSSLSGSRLEFGSRTASGRPLAGRPISEVRDELVGSRLRLEQMLDQPCSSVAYPGERDVEAQSTLAESGLAGYRIGLSRREGLNVVAALEPFALRRVTILPGLGHSPFQCALKTGRLSR